jgi:hypothetical protein
VSGKRAAVQQLQMHHRQAQRCTTIYTWVTATAPASDACHADEKHLVFGLDATGAAGGATGAHPDRAIAALLPGRWDTGPRDS